MQGVLPTILPLQGNGELADVLGLSVPFACGDATAMRIELAGFLKTFRGDDDVDVAAFEATMAGERLWRRADGLYHTLNHLAAHGISMHDLRQSVPPHMVGLWEAQAATLLAAAAYMDGWLAERGAVWPGEHERRLLDATAGLLPHSDWLPLVAGVVDGTPAARSVMDAVAACGTVLVPELGTATEQLVGSLGENLHEIAFTRLSMAVGELREAVADSDWDEAWTVALAVKQALARGDARVGVVCPARGLMERVAGILKGWGLEVPVGGSTCLSDTAAGRAALHGHYGLRHGTPATWLDAMLGAGVDAAVLAALQVVRPLNVWLDADDWQAVMGLVLGETAAGGAVSEGVYLLSPLQARLVDFDSVVVAGCVEGIWPTPAFDTWLSEPHLRALGLPDSTRKALLAGTEFESAVLGGSARVLLTRARSMDGRDTVPSRFLESCRTAGMQADTALVPLARRLRTGAAPEGTGDELGTFTPTGALWPSRWSASFVETMLACPYKALGDRILRLAPPDPLVPQPDPRVGGLLAHRWLERIGQEITTVTDATAAQVEDRLRALADFELRHETPVIKAIWRAKFAKLAPALVARWLADGRRVDAVEQKLRHDVGRVTITAKLDRVEAGNGGGKVIIDYKTSTPPSWSAVASGERPQLALEAWLMGHAAPVANVEYWQLRGYGTQPLNVTSPGGRSASLDTLLEPVEAGVERLVDVFAEGAPFMAVPDLAGGGLMPTGICARCDLAGVCRRKAVAAGERHV